MLSFILAILLLIMNIQPFNLLQRIRSLGSGDASSDKKPQSDGDGLSPIDVVVVRIMLVRRMKLPPDVVDIILDHAEYWAHSASEIVYGRQQNEVLRIRGQSREELKFLIRSNPAGLTSVDDTDARAKQHAYATTQVQPLPLGRTHDAAVFKKLANYPTPTLASPVRKIVFTIESKDQGWGGERNAEGVYEGSFTWFEAGLERFDADHSCDMQCKQNLNAAPDTPLAALPVCALRPLYPRITTWASFEDPWMPDKTHEIQRNKRADKNWTTHEVTWRWTDDVQPDSAAGQKLSQEGRGRGTGDGSFVRDMKTGDVVTIWGKAKFGGWVNYVRSVKVDVYWAV